MASETIVATAIWWDGATYSLPAPARHHDIFRKWSELPAEATRLDNQGFLTSEGRFVSRRQAAILARSAGQLIREPTPGWMLTSEDVW